MLKKVIVIVLLLCFAVNNVVVADNSGVSEKKSDFLYDLLSSPFKAILAPIEGGGLVDLVLTPARVALAPIPDMLDMVVTPGRTREYVYNVNSNVSVVTDEDIELTRPLNIQQLLGNEPGVVIGGYLNNAKDSNVDIRGSGGSGISNCLVLIDGRRTNQIDLSGSDLSQIDVNVIDRIEVLRGAGTVLYGDNATGGVINIITKKGEEGDHIEYRQEYGSYQYHKEYVSAVGSHDLVDYSISLAHQDSEGFRLNNAFEANDGFVSVKVKPSENINLNSTVGYHRDWYGMPGALFDGNLNSDGREGSRFPDDKSKTEDYFFTCDPEIYFTIGGNEAVLSVFTSFRSRRSNARNISGNIYETDHHIRSYDLRPKLEINSDLFEKAGVCENKLVLGADIFDAVDEILSGNVAVTRSKVDILKKTFGLYASDNLMIDKRYIVSGGVRGEWAKYVFDQKDPEVSYNTNSLRDAAFDIGLGYKYNERSQVYANYARSYRLPATDEYFKSAYEDNYLGFNYSSPAVLNTALKQQVGNNYEVGIKDNSFDFLKVRSAYYYMDNKNEIFYDAYIPENPETDRNENYSRTVHHGLELEIDAELYEYLRTFLNYTFQRSYFVGGKYASKTIPLVPENKITAGMTFYPFKGMDISCVLNYLGSRYAANDLVNSSSKIEGAFTVDIKAGYEHNNFKIFAFINNVLAEDHYSSATKNWQGRIAFYPAQEREFGVGISVKF